MNVMQQMETIVKNRKRRFHFLLKKDRAEDAVAIGEEFFEWLDPNQQNYDILFINESIMKGE